MKKLLSLILVTAFIGFEATASPVIFNGNTVKTQKSTIDINGGAQLLTGPLDPSVSATSAPKGSAYFSTSTGLHYQKSDSGSSTNWFVTSLADNSVTTAKVVDANITTAKIADGAITQAKRASLGQQISSSSGSFTTAAGSLVDVTNLSITLTTTGRPVWLSLQSDGSGAIAADTTTTAITASCLFAFDRDGSTIGSQFIQLRNGSSAVVIDNTIPPSAFHYVDTGATSGTHTYKFRANSQSANNTCYVTNAKLVGFEL